MTTDPKPLFSTCGKGPFPVGHPKHDPMLGAEFWWRIHDIPAADGCGAIEAELSNGDRAGDDDLMLSQEDNMVLLGRSQIVALHTLLGQYVRDGEFVVPPTREGSDVVLARRDEETRDADQT